MLIRRTEKTDGQTLRQLRIAALTDAPYAFGVKLCDVLREPMDKFATDAIRHSESDISTSFLAFASKQPVGMIGAYFEQPSQRPYICSLWLQTPHRGSAMSSALLKAATGWLNARGAKSCYAWVADDNTRAIAFYQKHGFSKTDINQPLPSNALALEHLYVYEFPAAGRKS